MPGTDPNTQDDDDGSIRNWLNYRVWKLRGWHIVLAVGLIGAATRWL